MLKNMQYMNNKTTSSDYENLYILALYFGVNILKSSCIVFISNITPLE